MTHTVEQLIAELHRANERYVELERCPDERTFNRVADARLGIEDALLSRKAETLMHMEIQIAILARRAIGGIGILHDLVSLSGLALMPTDPTLRQCQTK